MKSIRGEYYLNGHWTIEAAQALPVASTILQYERGVEGDLAPERIQARGPTSEPLVIEVSGSQTEVPWTGGLAARATVGQAGGLHRRHSLQLISQESNPGVHYEYYLPVNEPGRSFSWSHGSWGGCSAECGGGEHWGPGEDK